MTSFVSFLPRFALPYERRAGGKGIWRCYKGVAFLRRRQSVALGRAAGSHGEGTVGCPSGCDKVGLLAAYACACVLCRILGILTNVTDRERSLKPGFKCKSLHLQQWLGLGTEDAARVGALHTLYLPHQHPTLPMLG